MRLVRFFLLVLLVLVELNAQTPTKSAISLSGAGYGAPRVQQDAAPGQLLVIYISGIQTSIPAPQVNLVGQGGWPNNIAGIAVDLVQGNPPASVPVEVRGIQQAPCPHPEVCAPVTGITLQIPFSLHTDYAAKGEPMPELRISEQGAPAGGILLWPVSDGVHVLNTCDGTLIYISAAATLPPGACVPVVMDAFRLKSPLNPAHGGEQVAMYLYGLGAVTQTGNPLPKPLGEFLLNFDFRPNAPASPVVPGFGTLRSPMFTGYVNGGLYVVNFVIPPVPDGVPACDGTTVRSNLTVTLTGPNSYDAAQLCVE